MPPRARIAPMLWLSATAIIRSITLGTKLGSSRARPIPSITERSPGWGQVTFASAKCWWNTEAAGSGTQMRVSQRR